MGMPGIAARHYQARHCASCQSCGSAPSSGTPQPRSHLAQSCGCTEHVRAHTAFLDNPHANEGYPPVADTSTLSRT